jgi:hypothetical protein
MDFREFTMKLSLGELSTTSMIDTNDKSMLKQEHRAKVLNALNQGLTVLCSKFILLQKEALLQSNVAVSHYFLRKEFATTNTATVPFKYILDSQSAPFTEDVIKILAIYDSHGEQQFVDDLGQDSSLFLTEFDCIQIPSNRGQLYSVIYQAMHPVMIGTNPCQEVHVPRYLEEALLSYVAGKCFSHMNNPESTAKGAEHMGNFQSICAEIENRNLVNNSVINSHTKLEQRGFV